MSRATLSIFLLSLTSLVACSTVRVETATRPGAQLAGFETFGQAPPPEAMPASLPRYSERVEMYIHSAIRTTLEAKGYRRVDPAQADFVVAFDVAGETHEGVRIMPVYTGGLVGWEHDPSRTEYTGGALTIDVFDSRTRDRLWQGVGETDLFAPTKDARQAVEVVWAILQEFPER